MDLDKLQEELAEDEGCKYEIYNDHLVCDFWDWAFGY